MRSIFAIPVFFVVGSFVTTLPRLCAYIREWHVEAKEYRRIQDAKLKQEEDDWRQAVKNAREARGIYKNTLKM